MIVSTSKYDIWDHPRNNNPTININHKIYI